MGRTVIIDGDIIVFRASEAATDNFEVEIEEEDENFFYRTVLFSNKQQAINAVETMINKICERTKATEVVICLSDPERNFRKEVNPEYKANRKKKLKPLLYKFLRNYFIEQGYKVYERPSLEADDVIGILATSEKIIKGDKCVWSFDKDFKTIPCKFAKGTPEGNIKKSIISPEEADWWFMYQTLIGDRTDGYTGCRDIGDKKARKILGEAGQKSLEEMWKLVVDTYIQQGQTEEDALLNARMARILRNTDYDFKNKEVRLWKITNTNCNT